MWCLLSSETNLVPKNSKEKPLFLSCHRAVTRVFFQRLTVAGVDDPGEVENIELQARVISERTGGEYLFLM